MFTETITVYKDKEPERFNKLVDRFYNGEGVVDVRLEIKSEFEGVVGTFKIILNTKS
jgi:hypothetical protein